jgi:hypothetical protein
MDNQIVELLRVLHEKLDWMLLALGSNDTLVPAREKLPRIHTWPA